jgi:hypothetical protein
LDSTRGKGISGFIAKNFQRVLDANKVFLIALVLVVAVISPRQLAARVLSRRRRDV